MCVFGVCGVCVCEREGGGEGRDECRKLGRGQVSVLPSLVLVMRWPAVPMASLTYGGSLPLPPIIGLSSLCLVLFNVNTKAGRGREQDYYQFVLLPANCISLSN